MEVVFTLLMVFIMLAPFLILTMGIAQGHGKSNLEDEAQYEHFNPTAKPAREVDRKDLTAAQSTTPSPSVAKKAEETASIQDLSSVTLVQNVMQRQACYCFERQSVDEVRRIMRERNLPYLVVLDQEMRIVGMVTMRDLQRGKKPDPPPDGKN